MLGYNLIGYIHNDFGNSIFRLGNIVKGFFLSLFNGIFSFGVSIQNNLVLFFLNLFHTFLTAKLNAFLTPSFLGFILYLVSLLPSFFNKLVSFSSGFLFYDFTGNLGILEHLVRSFFLLADVTHYIFPRFIIHINGFLNRRTLEFGCIHNMRIFLPDNTL